MRIKSVAIENFRLIADSTIEVPSGLTLVNGENGLGKSSIFQAILWCLYGPGAVGDNQPSLVRQGQRNMSVTVEFAHQLTNYTAARQVRMSPNGKSGSTELTFKRHDPMVGSQIDGDLTVTDAQTVDRSGGTIAETQAEIDKTIGKLEIFMATAYVDQHDGPGAFLRSKPAEQRAQLRDMLNISPNWDSWFEIAKLKHKTGAERIVGNLGRVSAAQEFIEQNAGAQNEKLFNRGHVEGLEDKILELNLNLEDLQDAQDEVDKVIAENDRRTKALEDNQYAIDGAIGGQLITNDKKVALTALIEVLGSLDEERKVWLTQCDVWDTRNTEYQKLVRDHNDVIDEWQEHNRLLEDMRDYYGDIGTEFRMLEYKEQEIRETLKPIRERTHDCPTCHQPLRTAASQRTIGRLHEDTEAQLATVMQEIENFPTSPVDTTFISEELNDRVANRPAAPVSPGTRPVFESEAEYNSAKSAESDIAAVDAEIKTRTEQVKTLEDAREKLPTPDTYDEEGYASRTEVIKKINTEITQAETDKRDRERKLAAAENTLELIETRKTEITALEQQIEDDEKLQKDLDIVVTGVGPNGARQLMIDQQLADFQGECNEWLGVLLPGFSIYMDTQAESGRETFETAFTTPTGVVGWHGLSGAQRVGVGLSTRLALAGMVQARLGHTFETWIIDEADGSMRGEKREAFVAMLYKLQESGIDILVVSHADTVVERMDQRIEVVDAGGYTVVT